MSPRDVRFILVTAGLVAVTALTGKVFAPLRVEQSHVPSGAATGPRSFVLRDDVPWLGFVRGERLVVLPDALIRIGDVVALRSDDGEVLLTRFDDELMGCVAGLVVRDVAALDAA